MAFSRKHLGDGLVASAATETTMYAPSSTSVTATVGKLSFFNSHATDQIVVTVYGPHTGAFATKDIVEEFYLNPRKSHICREMVNAVVEGGNLISVACDTASALTFSLDGGEE